MLHDFQNAIGSENLSKSNNVSSKKSLSFDNDENTSNLEMSPVTVASKLHTSSLTGISESGIIEADDVLRKDSISVSTTTNKIAYILEELVCFFILI